MPTSDPRALLRRLLQQTHECEWLEFKQNNCNPEEIGRCVSACANAAMLAGKDRAFIVWGIEDGTRQRLGTSVCLQELKKGNENFTNWLTRLLEPKLMLEPIDFADRGRNFAVLTIDPSYDRPVRFSGTEYIRIGENIKPLRDFPEHERALWLATGRRRFESATALAHQTKEDILAKLDIDGYYTLAREPKPPNSDEIMRKLVMLWFVKEDWEGGYDITNLGAILFAKHLSLFPSISSKAVRVIKYTGVNKSKSEGEREGFQGYAVDFSGLMKHIMDKLPKEERYVGGVRSLASNYSEIAIREIVANALIHQDFTVSGAGPLIEIYRDRVEVVNPGNSMIERDRIISERQSRNERLAKAVRDLGICEERGGGIDKAIIDIEEKALPAPEFIPSKDSMRVVIFGPKKFKDLSKSERVWACFCHCVIRWVQNNFMSNSSLRERFSLPPDEYTAVSGVISEARKAKRIIPADPRQGNRNARYVPYWALD